MLPFTMNNDKQHPSFFENVNQKHVKLEKRIISKNTNVKVYICTLCRIKQKRVIVLSKITLPVSDNG